MGLDTVTLDTQPSRHERSAAERRPHGRRTTRRPPAEPAQFESWLRLLCADHGTRGRHPGDRASPSRARSGRCQRTQRRIACSDVACPRSAITRRARFRDVSVVAGGSSPSPCRRGSPRPSGAPRRRVRCGSRRGSALHRRELTVRTSCGATCSRSVAGRPPLISSSRRAAYTWPVRPDLRERPGDGTTKSPAKVTWKGMGLSSSMASDADWLAGPVIDHDREPACALLDAMHGRQGERPRRPMIGAVPNAATIRTVPVPAGGRRVGDGRESSLCAIGHAATVGVERRQCRGHGPSSRASGQGIAAVVAPTRPACATSRCRAPNAFDSLRLAWKC